MKKQLSKIGQAIKNIGAKKIIIATLLLVLSTVIIASYLKKTTYNTYYHTNELANKYIKTESRINIKNYSNAVIEYQEAGFSDAEYDVTINEDTLTGLLANNLYNNEYVLYGANHDIFILDESNQSLTFSVGDIDSGLYYLNLDYYILNANINETQIEVLINGVKPFHESAIITLPVLWEFTSEEFGRDRYSNEIQPQSEMIKLWQNINLKDQTGLHAKPFLYYLEADDEITINYTNYEVLVGEITLAAPKMLISYQEYLEIYKSVERPTEQVLVSARNIETRSDASIRLRAEQNPANMYYDTQHLILNTISNESWQNGGGAVSYEVIVEKTGLYNVAFNYRQYSLGDMSVFRTIKINGEVPFADLEAYAFPFTQDFVNRTLVDSNNEPLKIYLEAGVNTITLEANSYPYRAAIEKLKEIMGKIQGLALEVKQYTANGQDQYRDWDIEEFFPNAKTDIASWAEELLSLHSELKVLATKNDPSSLANLIVAANRLKNISEKINQLPSRMPQFSDGDSSVNQLIGTITQSLMLSGLELEKTIVYNDTKLPAPRRNFFVNFYEGTKRLILSFVNNPYKTVKGNKKDELVVWVNHPRQYIEVMQTMIDREYQGEYRVTLSQMPDQNKLILANASNSAPDLAIGIDHWIPYDFAIRGAALDLRQFSGYEELVKKFSKGAMIPYVFEEGVYALPETQNFWVTFYREDILNSIGITEIPQTWDEVIGILPILQSYGMNYFVPLAQFSGLKPFVATLPFIYQFGGDLYTENGMQTAINSEETLAGVKLMSDLFTLYNMPKYVASFYNHFRYGMLPIGISDLGTYLLLQNVAVELSGLWKMDLHPGFYNEETDEIVRFAAAGAQSSMILSSTTKPDAAWHFLNWWMETDTQEEFALILQSTYGKAYFWNSANLEAFANSSMPQEYKEVILRQWDYALEASRIPGSYMVERELSNAWTKIVFENKNPRLALDEAVRISNREILYKMAEFNYVVNGVVVKDYTVPSIYNIDNWLTEVKKNA